jgi:hypothetical protein
VNVDWPWPDQIHPGRSDPAGAFPLEEGWMAKFFNSLRDGVGFDLILVGAAMVFLLALGRPAAGL